MSQAAELSVISGHISEFVESTDEFKSYLPIDDSNVLSKLEDGVILARLTQKYAKDDLPNRLIKNPAADDAAKAGNLDAVAKALENRRGITGLDQGNKQAFATSVVMASLQQNINLTETIAIIRTLRQGEGLDTLLQMTPKQVLTRWLNHHLAALGYPLDEDQEEYVTDLHKDVSNEYLLALLKKLDTKEVSDNVTDSVENASVEDVLAAAGALEVNKYISKEALEGKWGLILEAFLSHVFNTVPGIHLPSEAEMDSIMNEIRSLQQKLKDCQDATAEIEDRIKKIGSEMERLQNKKDAVATESEYHALLRQLENIAAERKAFDDEMNRLLAEQKAKIDELQARLDELNKNSLELQEKVKGQGDEVSSLNQKVADASSKSNDKSRAIQEHAEKLREKLAQWGAAEQLDSDPSITIGHSDDDAEQLKLCLAAQKEMVIAYKASLNNLNERFERQKEDAKKRYEEINNSVSEYLNSGEGSAEDAIENMKKLLELLIEKCKRQQKQVKTYNMALEKMEFLNRYMKSKVQEYAETNSKSKKKGLFAKK